MKRYLKIAVIAIAVILLGIQLVRIDRSNPPVVPAQAIESHMGVPGDVSEILGRSCNDCHTHKTAYPWYSQVAPVSWWLRNHISDARRHLNMSEWGTYEPKKQAHKLEEICDEVRSGNMPLPSYLWVHHDAMLSEPDKDALCSWTQSERNRLGSNAQPGAK